MDAETIAHNPGLHSAECNHALLNVRDALEVLNGKWKLPILIALVNGGLRFRQLSKEVPGITDKMLSKELKDLEMNLLIKRTVFDTFPPTVLYERTEHSNSLSDVISALREWGVLHRQQIIGQR